MAAEHTNYTPEALTPYVNPDACEATVEIEVFSQYKETLIAGGEINCLKCNLHRRFDSVGTQQEISGDFQEKVIETVTESCLKLQSHGKIVSEELLPQTRVL